MSSSTSGKVYRIEEDSYCGRQLVATRKIYAGELIIDEPALLTGPGFTVGSYFYTKRNEETAAGTDTEEQAQIAFPSESHVCLVCCVNLTARNCINCPSCNLLLCNNETCLTHYQHTRNECLVFPKIRHIWKSQNRSRKSFYNSSEINGNFNNSETKEESSSVLYAARHCLDVMTTNAFSIFTESYSREGLFFLSSFMSDSCVINTDRQIEAASSNVGDISESRMVVRASVDIEKDEPITTTYLSLLYNTEERNRMLITSWLFTCQCKRCQDSRTECGTFVSGVICQDKLSRCDLETGENLSSLVCYRNSCNRGCRANMETNYLKKITQSRPNLLDTDKLEDWLDQHDNGKFLHPNHSVFAHVKLFIVQNYGRQPGGMDSLSVEQLKRKFLYCQQILGIYNKITPGIQMCRGIILFELWRTLQKISDLRVPFQITYPLTSASHDDESPLMSMSLQESDMTKIKMEALHILKYALPGTSEAAMANYIQEGDLPMTTS